MDFSVKDTRAPSVVSSTPGASNNHGNQYKRLRALGTGKWLRVAFVALLFGITILLIAIAWLLHSGGNDESKYINKNNFQAVDISVGGSSNGDQIYFGNIAKLNSSYLVLQNVYYIPASSSSSNITLEPLICQVDAPYNQMIVNRNSVNWWENLQSTGKVAQAISNYEKSSKTPSCPQTSSSSSNSPSSSNSSNSNSSSSNNSSTSNNSSSSNNSGSNTGSSTTGTGTNNSSSSK